MLKIAPLRHAAAAHLLLLAACTFSRERAVLPHLVLLPLPCGLVTAQNVQEMLQRGYVPEVITFLSGPAGRGVDAARGARLLAQAELEAGRFAVCEAIAGRLLSLRLRAEERAEVEWIRSQAAYFRGDFEAAARFADASRAAGRGVPEGWIAFLRSGQARRLFAGAEAGQRTAIRIRYGKPNLIRLAVTVNGIEAGGMIFDSGASLSLLTESAASRLGIEMVVGAVAPARGLHKKEIPMRFGWARTVAIGTFTLHDVPFGILPDESLSFETEAVGVFRPDGVLGVHLLKEFDWRIELSERRLQAIRLAGIARSESPGQNVFFRRMKPMVRVSFNRQPWSLFLLDTGSEPTMVTPEGLAANRYTGYEPSAPITLEGIGKSHVSWSKVSDVTLGTGRHAVWFKNLVVNEGGDTLGDGIIGMSFLSLFDVELRFSNMTLSLDRTGARRGGPPRPFEPLPAGPASS